MLFCKLKNIYDVAQISAKSSAMTEKRFGFAPIAQNETHKPLATISDLQGSSADSQVKIISVIP